MLALTLSFSAPGLRGVLHAVGHINPMWIALAAGLELASELSFVVLFRLFFDRLPGRDALALAWTELASGALLPGGGTGGLAIVGRLIHLTGAPTRWIAQRSGGLFFLTSAVSAASLIGAGLALIATHHAPHGFLLVVLPTVLVTAATVAVAALPRLLRPRAPARPAPPPTAGKPEPTGGHLIAHEPRAVGGRRRLSAPTRTVTG